MNKTPDLSAYSVELEAFLQRMARGRGAGDMRDCSMAVAVAGVALSHAAGFADGRAGFEDVLRCITFALVSLDPLQTLLAVGGPLDE